jgi:ribosomal protein S18 acetylase RimI-like enzyme
VEIRQLTEDDAAIYREVRLRGLREDPEGFGETYEEALARPLAETVARFRSHDAAIGTFILGAYDDAGALVGMVTMVREPQTKLRHRANIYGMYVAPEARRSGIGRALLAEVCARAARIDGLEQLHLYVVTSNEAAQRLYQSVGFVTYGTAPGAFKLGDQYWDDNLMVYQVRPSAGAAGG